MRILIVHARYREPGGEDTVVDASVDLFTRRGVDVTLHLDDNRRIRGNGSLGTALATVWSPSAYRALRRAIAVAPPDLVHVHNTFPLLSPAVYYAARSCGVPVVQTLHNYRLLCPKGLLLRDARPCELCLCRTVKWPGVRHACYRGSHAASAVVAAMSGVHHVLGTWAHRVDRFVALTPFARRLFVAGGLPEERLAVLPPPIADPGPLRFANPETRSGGLFVGRLSAEKGLETLLEAWRGIDAPLDVIGDGPLAGALMAAAPPNVRFHGHRPHGAVSAAMARAALLLAPSLAYENFPIVVAEAMAHGLPVLATAGGAAGDMLEDGVTGAFARRGDAADWHRHAVALLSRPNDLRRRGAAARDAFEARYAPDTVFDETMALYRGLLDDRRAGPAV